MLDPGIDQASKRIGIVRDRLRVGACACRFATCRAKAGLYSRSLNELRLALCHADWRDVNGGRYDRRQLPLGRWAQHLGAHPREFRDRRYR